MANERLPDALWLRIAPLIPPEAPKPRGVRLRLHQVLLEEAGPGRSHRLGPGPWTPPRYRPQVAKKRARTQRTEAKRARSASLWPTPRTYRSRSS